jgi:hypothetical protein
VEENNDDEDDDRKEDESQTGGTWHLWLKTHPLPGREKLCPGKFTLRIFCPKFRDSIFTRDLGLRTLLFLRKFQFHLVID